MATEVVSRQIIFSELLNTFSTWLARWLSQNQLFVVEAREWVFYWYRLICNRNASDICTNLAKWREV